MYIITTNIVVKSEDKKYDDTHKIALSNSRICPRNVKFNKERERRNTFFSKLKKNIFRLVIDSKLSKQLG